MSLRSLIRLLTLALVCLPLSVPLWSVGGAWFLLVGPGLLLLTLGYLALTAGSAPLSRWQLRYYVPEQGDTNLARLGDALNFLVARSGCLVLEANAAGLFLELPSAFDRYVEAQLPRALPEVKLSRDNNSNQKNPGGTFYLSVGAPNSEILRWATEAEGRQIRLHIHPGPYATLAARTDGLRPPGPWLCLPVPRPFRKLWSRLPLWDEVSAGVELGRLLPATADGAVYSSRSRLLGLKPPQSYRAEEVGRRLGRSVDGRPLTSSYTVPLFTVGAPALFLAGQIAADLARGGTVVVVSPDRRFLDRVRHETPESVVVRRLDPQNSRASARLAIVAAEEWAEQDTEAVIALSQTFLQDLGLDVDLATIGDFGQRLLYALAEFARRAGRDLAFTDLYAVCQNTRALQAFLTDLRALGFDDDPALDRCIHDLLHQIGSDEGYVQAVAILSTIRAALSPLQSGPLHTLCQGPYFSADGISPDKARLLLAPMTNLDFPEHDRLLSTMLDLVLSRALATGGGDLRLTLHLHDPHLYRQDGGQRWIDLARRDDRFSLLLDVRDPANYSQVRPEGNEGELVFRCSESLASTLIRAWKLPATVTELGELPEGMAVARLVDTVVTLDTVVTSEANKPW